jgi:uncharacterized protein
MKVIFADTSFWVAKINPADALHLHARKVELALGAFELVTSEPVLMETLNYFSGFRANVKRAASDVVHEIIESGEIEVVTCLRRIFEAGQSLYDARLDKGYSLTDCISMNLMRERGITDILTHDHHFTQEGFTVLL